MLFHILHRTRYDFNQPVALESHVLRFQPRSDGAQFLRDFQLIIHPDPIGSSHHLDAHGNSVTLVWFEQPSCSLTIVAEAKLETRRTNPFDYLLTESNSRLPVCYPPEIAAPLSGAMAPAAAMAVDDPVSRLAADFLARHDRVSEFLVQLCGHIHEHWETVRREHGAPWPPAKTCQQRRRLSRSGVVLCRCCPRGRFRGSLRQRLPGGNSSARSAGFACLGRGLRSRGRLARLRPDTRARGFRQTHCRGGGDSTTRCQPR